jgi:NADPH:quinone reductase-like Zn-dependent oxidoreductase
LPRVPARWITHRRLRPVIDTSFHLGVLSAALAHLEKQAHFGKVTISFGDA